MSSLGRLARRPKYDNSYDFLIAQCILGALQGAQTELVKFDSLLCFMSKNATLLLCTAQGVSLNPASGAALYVNTKEHRKLGGFKSSVASPRSYTMQYTKSRQTSLKQNGE